MSIFNKQAENINNSQNQVIEDSAILPPAHPAPDGTGRSGDPVFSSFPECWRRWTPD